VDIDPATRVGLSFLHERPVSEETTTRQLALLGLVHAPFRAAVLANISLAAYRARLAHVMDSITPGLLICDFAGRMLHRNPEMKRLLAQEPERDLIAAEIRQIVLAVGQRARRRPGAAHAGGHPASCEVRTRSALYSLRASCVGPTTVGADGGILIALERLTPEMPPGEVLGERYALTKREIDVTYLLLHGKSNADIAQALAISEHTARHHTESVLAKLGVHSRTEIPRLFRPARERDASPGDAADILGRAPSPSAVSRRSGEWLQPLEFAFGFGRNGGAPDEPSH
jgi:DNA-binding CsgD family transcriptional regulator